MLIFTHDCVAKFCPNSDNFADGTTVVDQISNNGATEYKKDLESLVIRCQRNLSLNVSKTRELDIDIKKHARVHAPINTNGSEVKIVESS